MTKIPNNKPVPVNTLGSLGLRHFRHFPLVLVISISNLRFVWNLMLGIWDFKDSVNGYSFFFDQTGSFECQRRR